MENEIYNEANGLWYEKQGYYYLPCVELPKQGNKPIGIWGQRHKRYLKQNHEVLYMNLLTSGKLNGYLADINEQAEDMFFRLVKQMAERESVTEQLKSDNQMEWVTSVSYTHLGDAWHGSWRRRGAEREGSHGGERCGRRNRAHDGESL